MKFDLQHNTTQHRKFEKCLKNVSDVGGGSKDTEKCYIVVGPMKFMFMELNPCLDKNGR